MMRRTRAVIASAVLIAAAVSACAADEPEGTPSLPTPTVTSTPIPTPVARTVDTPLDALDAYSMCQTAFSKFHGIDPDFGAMVDSFADADIAIVDGFFELEFDGVTDFDDSGFKPSTYFCVVTGTLGDPRLVYNGADIGTDTTGGRAGWADRKPEVVAAHPGAAVGSLEVTDREREIAPLEAWALCRTIRLSQEPSDYIAEWPGFAASAVTRIDAGFVVSEEFTGGILQNGPVPYSSACLIDGALAEPFPVVYFGRPKPDDPLDELNDFLPYVREQLGLPPA